MSTRARPDGPDIPLVGINSAGRCQYAVGRPFTNRNTFNGFGGVTSQTNAAAGDRYLYTAREYQADTGYQFNRGRWYDTATGRWTTIDPIGFQAGDKNLYRYVTNAPTLANDPSGLRGVVVRPVPVRPVQQPLRPTRPVGGTGGRPSDSVPPDRPSRDILEDLKVSPVRRGPAVESTPTDYWDRVRQMQLDERMKKIVEQAAREAETAGATPEEIHRILNERRFGVDVDQLNSRIVAELRAAGQRAQRERVERALLKNRQTYYRNALKYIAEAVGAPKEVTDPRRSDDEVLGLVRRHIEDMGMRGRDSAALRDLDSKLRRLELAKKIRPEDEKASLELVTDAATVAQAISDPEGKKRRPVSPGEATQRRNEVCFAAGTLLLTPTGATRIELLQPGDLVLARPEHEADGPVEAKNVEDAFTTTARLQHIHVGGQVIRTTPEHPFYVQGKGWTPTKELEAGDLLSTHEGRWTAVTAVVATAEYETVYNVRVAEYHTYFVGCDEWGWSVWAHNICWYHGTDSASATSILTIGPDKIAFEKSNPVDPSGLFFTPKPTYALECAESAADQRNRENNPKPNPPLTPVVLVVDDKDIGRFLVDPEHPFPPGSKEDGEKIHPVRFFGLVPASAFRIWIPGGP